MSFQRKKKKNLYSINFLRYRKKMIKIFIKKKLVTNN